MDADEKQLLTDARCMIRCILDEASENLRNNETPKNKRAWDAARLIAAVFENAAQESK